MTTRIAMAAAALLVASLSAQQRPKQQPDVRYVPTPQNVVEAMLQMARVTSADVVYDLGSGDGRIPITAAQKYGARGVGIEIEPRLVREANDNAVKARVADRVWFVTQDLFETDLSPATVVTLYLLPRLNQQLMPKLKRLRPTADSGEAESAVDAEAETPAAWHTHRVALLRHGARVAARPVAGHQQPDDLSVDDSIVAWRVDALQGQMLRP